MKYLLLALLLLSSLASAGTMTPEQIVDWLCQDNFLEGEPLDTDKGVVFVGGELHFPCAVRLYVYDNTRTSGAALSAQIEVLKLNLEAADYTAYAESEVESGKILNDEETVLVRFDGEVSPMLMMVKEWVSADETVVLRVIALYPPVP